EIGNAMMEYQIQQDFLSKQEDEDGSPMSEQTLSRVNDRINELYDFIINHKVFKQYGEAEANLNELIKNINRTIVAQITGEMAADCTHDCSTCGGCH
ncbi:MAG: YlbF family regulator, partial [Clostridia bacterium]|nr:YlbF family regulator [Clostridia bacterium]